MPVIPSICTGLQLAVISLAQPCGAEQTEPRLAADIQWPANMTCGLFGARTGGIVIPQKSWRAKRARQYVRIEDSLLDQGKPQPLGRGDCGTCRQQAACAARRVRGSQPFVNQPRVSGPARRPALAPGARRSAFASASQPGPTAWFEEALHDEQGATRGSAQAVNARPPVEGGCASLQPRTGTDSVGPIEVPGDAL